MITFQNVEFYRGKQKIIDQVSFDLKRTDTHIILGKSGAGKTTILQLINKMLKPESGEITFGVDELNALPANELRKKMGYVMQGDGLFPHYTVFDNIATVPRLLKWSNSAISFRVKELMEMLKLPLDLMYRYPSSLSGGQRQRVSIARAFAPKPEILLMDEPFGALDTITKSSIMHDFKHLEELVETTTVMVTHDISEAVYLGDNLMIFEDGKITFSGNKRELMKAPQAELFIRENRFQLELMAVDQGDESLYSMITKKLREHKREEVIDLINKYWN